MFQVLIGIVGVVLTFGLAIFVHELGHFLAARLRGVGVEAFAIGMGPKIVAWRRGQTEYSLRWLPVGGFVKLHQIIPEEAGMNGEMAADAVRAKEELKPTSDQERSLGDTVHEDMEALYDKGLFTKLLVFSAGVIFNVFAAIAAMALIWMIGFHVPVPGPALVGMVPEGSPVYEAGLRQGDVVVGVEGTETEHAGEVFEAIEAASAGTALNDGLDVTVLRDGEQVALTLPPLTEETDTQAYFSPWAWDSPPYVGGVIPFEPADKAGLQEGDLIVAIDGEPVELWSQMSKIIRASLGEVLILTVQREGEPEPIKVTLQPTEDVSPEGRGTGVIGIAQGTANQEFVRDDVLSAIVKAPGRTWFQLKTLAILNYEALFKSSFAEIKKGVGGPIAIATLTYERSQMGLIAAMQWFITLNLILAIMNLLPIPVLDGGFIVLSIIEAVIRRPVPSRIVAPIYTLSAICLIMLFILISIQDFLRTLF